MRSLLYCCRPCITKTGRETWDSCGSIEPICIHVWWCEWSLQHRFRHHRLAVVEMCRLCYFCILQALFLSFTDILFTTLLWGLHALQWFLKWSFQYSFEFILFYMVSGILIWAFGLILGPFVSISEWLKNCVAWLIASVHTWRGHISYISTWLYKFWIWMSFPHFECVHVQIADLCMSWGGLFWLVFHVYFLL